MSEKPEKRLVPKRQSLRTMLQKLELYSMVFCFGGFGGIVALVALLLVGLALFGASERPDQMDGRIVLLIFGAIFGATAAGFLWAAHTNFKAAKQIERVALLTPQNAKHLPEVETLVRGSDRPATAEQTELLRSMRQSPETPPEQLLRATQESRQDV